MLRKRCNKGFFYINFQAANNVEFIIARKKISGSVLDIDAYAGTDELNAIPSDDIFKKVDECHLAQKSKFFSIINKDFLNSLNPIWEEEQDA